MDLFSLSDDAHLPQVQEESMKRVITILQSVSDHQRTPEPDMLTSEYRRNLQNKIAHELEQGEFAQAKDMIIRLNLIDMHITQSYADIDAGVKEKLDSALQKSHSEGKPINQKFLVCAAERYQTIIDRMDLEGQTANPALIEYLNIYATVLELLGEHEQAQRVHERIPSVMVSMLEQQKGLAAKFCLAEKTYWDRQIAAIEEKTCLSYADLKNAQKALRFYEAKEAVLCAITHDEEAIQFKVSALRSLVIGTRVA
jgi:hypothetical protein